MRRFAIILAVAYVSLNAAVVAKLEGCSVEHARAAVSAFLPVLSTPTRITGSAELSNTPRQWYSFGLASGYITAIEGDPERPRAQISNNTIQPHPFNRALTMATVALTWGYQPSTFEPSVRERLPRLFVGFPFTPYFGVAAGASVLLTRPLSLSVGRAWLGYDTATRELFGQKPSDPGDPLDTAHARAWFLSVGYAFTK